MLVLIALVVFGGVGQKETMAAFGDLQATGKCIRHVVSDSKGDTLSQVFKCG